MREYIKEVLEKYDKVENITLEKGEMEYDEDGDNGLPSIYYTIKFKNGNSYKWNERNIFDFGTVYNPCFSVCEGKESGGLVKKNKDGKYVFEIYENNKGWKDVRQLTDEELESYNIVKELSIYKGIMRM